jgi:hypothetical protein
MYTSATALARTLQAGLSLAEVNLKAAEMAAAASAVIGYRMGLIAAAGQNPLAADHAELGRMIPEKVAAFSAAGLAAMEAYWSLQRDLANYMSHVGRMMTAGRLPLPSELAELAERTSIDAARLAGSGVEAASVAIAPLHRKATSNARRLARRKRRT